VEPALSEVEGSDILIRPTLHPKGETQSRRRESLHPFDLRTALLAKHAQHVVLIHFPIALFVIGAAFDLAGYLRKKAALVSAASYNFFAAGVSAIPAVGSGLLAWQWALEGRRLHGILLQHLVLGVASALLLLTVAWIHFSARRLARALPRYRFALELAGVIVVGITGHLGGFLSGVNAP
jgi:uncharacterized membrane protein